VSALCLLDLTAAFDTVDHELLLLRLERHFGVRGVTLRWFSQDRFLDRGCLYCTLPISQIIIINNNSREIVDGAVIMTKVIARVHPVHLMNVD